MSEDQRLPDCKLPFKNIFVNRYKISHCKRRKQLRRAKKDGFAVVIKENRDGWLYRVPNHFKLKK